jgi:hypothetical protein
MSEPGMLWCDGKGTMYFIPKSAFPEKYKHILDAINEDNLKYLSVDKSGEDGVE